MALVEAMLCGRPAIVTDVAGNTELIEHGLSGFVGSLIRGKVRGEAEKGMLAALKLTKAKLEGKGPM